MEEDWGDLGLGLGQAAAEEPAKAARAVRGATPREIALEEGPESAARPIELPPGEPGEVELAPMHAFVPPPEATGHRPEAAAPKASDGGEAALREALSKASLEVIERVVWEVVPQLAETIIRENLDRLAKERQGS